MAELRLNYCVLHPGELAAGVRGYSETVTVTVESGDPGGEPGEFAGALWVFLKDWFDGAHVRMGEWAELAGPDHEEKCQSAACAMSKHDECTDVDGNCCDCSCHLR